MYHPFFHPLLHQILSLLKRRRLPLGGLMRLAVCCVILCVTQGVAHAQFTLTQTFLNPMPVVNDWFGNSVAVDGNWILVGAPLDGTTGAAYLFDATTGALVHTFTDPTPASNGYFGGSVAVDGNWVLVGAERDNRRVPDAGAAYLFDATTGALLHTFTNPTPAPYDSFGYSVSVDGDHVLVGANGDNTGAPEAGAAYLFDATTGALVHTFTNPTPAASDNFSISVSVDGDHVLVGADLDDTGAPNAGAAYLFDATTGVLLHTFTNPTPAQDDVFGFSVSVDGDRVLVGADLDDTGAPDAGVAYFFDATTGALVHTFTNPTSAGGDQFGYSVSVDGDHVLVGADLDDTGAPDAGAVYLFDATTGALVHTFINPTLAGFDAFGYSVSVDGDHVLVGAPFDDTGAPAAGAAYLFGPSPFTLDLRLNKEPPVYQKGDRMLVTAHLFNPGPTQTVRYLQQLFLPNGSEFLRTRIDQTVSLTSGEDVVDTTFNRHLPAIPAGDYRWRARLLDPETSQVWVEDTASWEFVGTGGSRANLAQLVGGLDLSASPARPVATQLRAPYPNPFNPETWIPYHLAERAHVRIFIYDLTGKLVRTLELGERAPGSYLDPSRAAHWDGRNDAGEPVASGVYFVQFHAGDFRASRKMILEK